MSFLLCVAPLVHGDGCIKWEKLGVALLTSIIRLDVSFYLPLTLALTYLTEGPIALLVVSVVAEGVPAVGAGEALRVEVLVERRHALVEDGLVAPAAPRREQALVVVLAVRLPVALEEVLRAELLVAMRAHEVLQPRKKKNSYH